MSLSQEGPALIRELLRLTGEDPERPDLVKTPQRFCDAFAFLTSGYTKTVAEVVNGAVFDVDESMSNVVVVKDIQFSSLCEHHLLPFTGVCHVGYLPRNKVLGLSKIPRIVDVFARRLQIQERLGAEIAQAVVEAVDPLGVAVVIEASHMCMSIRGVEKSGAKTQTSCVMGLFRSDPKTRSELFDLLKI
jgi:GTP cyclohydrolase I